MKRVELIKWALTMTGQNTAKLIAPLSDKPLLQPTPGAGNGGNHAIWTLGHLCAIEGSLPHILVGEPASHGNWFEMFGTGTMPKTDPAAYPTFDEMLKTFTELREKNLKLLDRIGDAGLDAKPKNVPPGFEQAMTTVGQTFLLIALHNMVHYGEVCDIRRVAGIKPMM
jgi:hypothetical protein